MDRYDHKAYISNIPSATQRGILEAVRDYIETEYTNYSYAERLEACDIARSLFAFEGGTL